MLRVIEELDNIMTALRLLIKACEKIKLHIPTHALELCLELILRRRNYILNVCRVTGTGLRYDAFPCENCSITYPTAFILSWLEYVLKEMARTEGDNSCGCEDVEVCLSLLCKCTCTLHFGTRLRADHVVDGILYPLGAPYVTGPRGNPPRSSLRSPTVDIFSPTHDRLVSECDEIECLYRTVNIVYNQLLSNAFREDDNPALGGDRALAKGLATLLHARRHFGFDMDCVTSTEVDASRSKLSEALQSYSSVLLAETFTTLYPSLATRQ